MHTLDHAHKYTGDASNFHSIAASLLISICILATVLCLLHRRTAAFDSATASYGWSALSHQASANESARGISAFELEIRSRYQHTSSESSRVQPTQAHPHLIRRRHPASQVDITSHWSTILTKRRLPPISHLIDSLPKWSSSVSSLDLRLLQLRQHTATRKLGPIVIVVLSARQRSIPPVIARHLRYARPSSHTYTPHSPPSNMRTARRTSVCASLADQLAESMTIKTPGIPLLTVAGPSPAPTPTPSIDDGIIDHASDNSPASSPAMSDYSLFSERSCTSSNATSLAMSEAKTEDVCMTTEHPRHAASTPLRHLGTLSFASSASHGQQHTPQNVKVYLASASNAPTPSTSLPISRFVARRNALAPGNGPYTPSSCGPTRQTKGNRTARTAYMSSHVSDHIDTVGNSS